MRLPILVEPSLLGSMRLHILVEPSLLGCMRLPILVEPSLLGSMRLHMLVEPSLLGCMRLHMLVEPSLLGSATLSRSILSIGMRAMRTSSITVKALEQLQICPSWNYKRRQRAACVTHTAMTTVQITLPDDLAQKVGDAGLLSDDANRQLFEDAMRHEAAERLRQTQTRIDALNLRPMSQDEVQAEIDAACHHVACKLQDGHLCAC